MDPQIAAFLKSSSRLGGAARLVELGTDNHLPLVNSSFVGELSGCEHGNNKKCVIRIAAVNTGCESQ
jgi:hypothetical protein